MAAGEPGEKKENTNDGGNGGTGENKGGDIKEKIGGNISERTYKKLLFK